MFFFGRMLGLEKNGSDFFLGGMKIGYFYGERERERGGRVYQTKNSYFQCEL